MQNKNHKDLYIVYTAKHDGKLLYIGSGKYGRELHCNSGYSHVYEMNRLHFEGVTFEVDVIERFETKEDSLDRERILILENKPVHNVTHNSGNPSMHKGTPSIARISKDWKHYLMKLGLRKQELYVFALESMLIMFCRRILSRGLDFKTYKGDLPLCIKRMKTSKTSTWKEFHDLFMKEGVFILPEVTPS